MEILLEYLNGTHLTSSQIQKVIEYIDFLKFLEKEEEKKIIPYPEKSHYTFEDLEAIAEQYPENKVWTYAQLVKAFPETTHKIEIIHHKLHLMPAPSILHQEIAGALYSSMRSFILKNNLGRVYIAPVDVKLDEENVYQPDILFIAKIREDIIGTSNINGSPDLVVEILSPANYKKEREAKRANYEKFGVTEYWEIYPKQQKVCVEVLKANGYEVFSEAEKTGSFQSFLLQGFEMKVEELIPLTEDINQ